MIDLYRYHDAAGTLLYVGISRDALRRLSNRNEPWLIEVATTTIEHLDVTWDDALVIERYVIRREAPKYNRAHNSVPDTLDQWSFISPLIDMVVETGIWEGTMGDLFHALTERAPGELPETSPALGRLLRNRQCRDVLTSAGIHVNFRRTMTTRTVHFTVAPAGPS